MKIYKLSLNLLLGVLFLGLFALFNQNVFGQDPLAGETKIEESRTAPENILMGNISAGRASDRIAGIISDFDPGIEAIVVYNKEQAETLAAYEKTLSQLQDLFIRYQQLLAQQKNLVDNFNRRPLKPCSAEKEKAVLSPEFRERINELKSQIDAAADLTGSFVKLLSYFRTNVELRPEVFDVDEKVAVAEVFRGLRLRFGNQIKLYNTTSIPPSFTDSEMVRLIQAVLDFDEKAADNTDLIKDRLVLVECNSADIAEKQKLTRLIADFKRNNRMLGEIINGLGGKTLAAKDNSDEDKETDTAADSGGDNKKSATLSGSNLLTAYLCVENIYRMIRKGRNGYWLEIKPIKAGGTTRVKTNLIADVFTGGNRVSHSGASLIEYNLYDATGLSVLSGIVPDYIPYVKPKRIPDLIQPAPRVVLAKAVSKKPNARITKNIPNRETDSTKVTTSSAQLNPRQKR